MTPQKTSETNLIRISTVISRTGISRSQIYNLSKLGKFPSSVPLNPEGSSVAWIESEIDHWINERIAARKEA